MAVIPTSHIPTLHPQGSSACWAGLFYLPTGSSVAAVIVTEKAVGSEVSYHLHRVLLSPTSCVPTEATSLTLSLYS